MNSGSFSGVVAVASTVSDTSKVLGSNWRVATLTLSESCGCFCSIRLCGARGFSKLRSLMYWPCKVSGLTCCCCGCESVGPEAGGGVVVICFFRCWRAEKGVRAGTMQGCTAQDAGRDDSRQLPSGRPATTIKTPCLGKAMNGSSLRPLVGVTACYKENGRGGWHHTVGDKYVQAAIRAVGGLPV